MFEVVNGNIIPPHSYVEYKSPEVWNSSHYNAHYQEFVKPVFDVIRDAVNEIELTQTVDESHARQMGNTHCILWNKCRYFEFTIIDNELRKFVAQSAGVKVQYKTMIIGGRHKLHRVVRALNKKGYYAYIEQNWI